MRYVSAMRPDGSQVVVSPRGGGWVQHPFNYRGVDYARRTYVLGGRTYDRYYRIYPWRDMRLSVYSPTVVYPYQYYIWLRRGWGSRLSVSWGWQSAGWYGAYGGAFAPYPTYYSPAMWITDYALADSMNTAYQQDQAQQYQAQQDPTQQGQGGDGAIDPQTDITPMPTDVKYGVTREIQGDIATLQRESQLGSTGVADSPSGSIAELLSDNLSHTFVAGDTMMFVQSNGDECKLTPGDTVLYAPPAPQPGADAVNVQVSWSKDHRDCAAGSTVTVLLSDLQEMHNHMLAKVDQGINELHTQQAAGKLPQAQGVSSVPTTQGFVSAAPASGSNAQAEVSAQSREADKVEDGVTHP